MSFFRYPGGKSKLRNEIAERLNLYAQNTDLEYREPFFGGGSIGLNFLHDHPSWLKLWINDKDAGVASLWTSVVRYADDLSEMVQKFVPSVQKFDEFKEELTQNNPMPRQRTKIVEYGFKKLAIHQISYSGLGTMSGGPLGGRKPENVAGKGSTKEVKYPIDCRWSPDYICKKIKKLHEQFSNYTLRAEQCTCLDFAEVIADEDADALIYLDPPYYIKGNDLYQHGFTVKDHRRLADELKKSKHFWVLSYDDCEEVRSLYDFADVCQISGVNYSITATKDENGERKSRTKPELLIYPKERIANDIAEIVPATAGCTGVGE